MNQVGLNTRAGRVFWGSLVGYCFAFGGFYFTTQHTYNRVNIEEQSGAFLGFKQAICTNGAGCSDVSFNNYLRLENKLYMTEVEVTANKPINAPLLQSHYAEFIKQLPWYVRMQFSPELVIIKVNGKPFAGMKS